MNQLNTYLISCVRAALTGQSVDCNISRCITIAHQHGVLNLLYYAMARMPSEQQPDEKIRATLKQQTYAAVVRETMQQQKLEEIYRRFEASQIRCVALKGAVTKALYPKPELRYMSDIDLLIDASKAEEVKKQFEEMGCRILKFDQGDTDQYLTPEGLNFEVKKTLCSESFNAQTRDFLDKLLSFAEPMEGCGYVCRLPNEEHYAYILCHIVKHLLNGGVGIRPIMDIWVCNNHMPMDRQKREKLLDKLELSEFAKTVEHLAFVWFGEEKATQLDEELGNYILGSGAFGTEEQRVVDRMLRQNNRFTYTLKRLFPPYQTMKRYFPGLKKFPPALPFYWIWRWIRAVLFRRKSIGKELETVGNADTTSLTTRAAFYQRCGLNVYKKKG